RARRGSREARNGRRGRRHPAMRAPFRACRCRLRSDRLRLRPHAPSAATGRASARCRFRGSRAYDRRTSWRIAGRYLEACNCDAICPCRRIGGVTGGRSTYGICFGALGWQVREGAFDGVDLAGSAAVLTFSYSDDEPGSPWMLVLYVDGADELATILLGEAGGDHILTLPWV